jgi:hypothetical protein
MTVEVYTVVRLIAFYSMQARLIPSLYQFPGKKSSLYTLKHVQIFVAAVGYI